MNSFISKAALEARRERYKKGTRVELISMADPYTKLKPGDTGTVDFVDDTGTVFIIWDSGSHLGAVFGEDEIRIACSKAEVVKAQTRKVADTGRTNMFDINVVFKIAMEMGFDELANFILTDTKRYVNLIFTGKLENVE